MRQTNIKMLLRRLLIIFLLTTFAVNLITGMIKFPELQRFFIGIYNYYSASQISWWHDYSGLALGALIIIHLIINTKRLSPFLKNALNKLRQHQNGKILISTILTILAAILLITFILLSYWQRPVKLSGVEITNYQGEKLGSINDFRENSIKGPQYINKDSYKLEITGLVSAPTSYSYDEILKLQTYQKLVSINCVEGWSVKVLWDGILVKDLLKNSEIKPEAKTIIFYSVDGYTTSFPLDYILNNNIIMANKMNGVALPPERGFPFQLVAEQKWGYKWIKWITKIELSSDINYKGFWESRGYNNNGDLDDSELSQ